MKSGDTKHLTDAALALMISLGLPLVCYLAGLGSVTRLLYPVSSLLLAGYFFRRNSPWYFGLCVWLFCFTSLVRRLVDVQAGFDPSNPVLLAPYLAASWSVLALLRPATWEHPMAKVFAVILACVAWGYVLAALDGRIVSGLVDAMKWSSGPIVSLYALTAARDPAVAKVAARCFLIAAPGMGIYGLLQFIQPSEWDVFWMINVARLGLDSIGQPQPFAVRVFSTMNSPGSLGAIMLCAILLATRLPALLSVAVVLPSALGLMLAQYRTIWIATALGLAIVAWFGRASDRARIGMLIAALVFATTFAAIVPQMRDALLARAQSLGQLQSDASGEIRAQQYQTFFGTDDASILVGQGLGLTGASTRLDGKNPMILDSALLESVGTLGLIVACVFLGSISFLVVALFGADARRVEGIVVYRAIALTTVFQLPFGNVQTGEAGFSMWLFFGIAFSLRDVVRRARQQHTLNALSEFPGRPAVSTGFAPPLGKIAPGNIPRITVRGHDRS